MNKKSRRWNMKKIEAIIRPGKSEKVRNALQKLGYPGITVIDVEGHGQQKGITAQWRGEKYRVDLLPKIKLEIVAKDEAVEKIIETISNNAKTGKVGDGKIFVSPVDNVVRIRTGEEGEETL
jgi:nitrogen regulatory protein P-II 1